MPDLTWLLFVVAAILEVGGDARSAKDCGAALAVIAAGCATLAFYGVVVNLVKWDFSKLLGVYVAFFALISVFCGLLIFRETVPATTWLGLAIIVAGGMVIQYGPNFVR